MTHSKWSTAAHTRRVALAWLGLFLVSAHAQPTGLLYDPEPPVDSGYVRVMVAADMPKVSVSVMVGEKVRIPSLAKEQVSDYMVVGAGMHQIALVVAKKTVSTVSLDVIRGSAVTVVFTSPDIAPHVFVDKTSTNKLKAMLSIYQLASQNDPLDVLTSDGATKVFSGLVYGKLGAMQVNPISVDLIATKSGAKTSLAAASLAMTQGGAYSIFLLPTKNEKIAAIQVQNKIERYTGK
jgi:alginate O-acetyltransferase complex protein AlgF